MLPEERVGIHVQPGPQLLDCLYPFPGPGPGPCPGLGPGLFWFESLPPASQAHLKQAANS